MNSPATDCRVLRHGLMSGEDNMAIDNEMLEWAVSGSATWRTYQWEEPTVSLGHFQVTSEKSVPKRFAELPVVKRLSGGGAILHDQELTYSLALPNSHPLTRTPSQIYNVVHQCIIAELAKLGIDSSMRGDAAFADQSFLCFLRGDERDIVIGQHKIVGSAQRRRQGAVLQHGSILLRQSIHTPEFPGILELTGNEIALARFVDQLTNYVFRQLGLTEVSI